MKASCYDQHGAGYARQRRPDVRIAAQIHAALGSAKSVLNVGAGTGSYEPRDRRVIALEPSLEMIRQRAPGAAPALRAVAERVPVRAAGVDGALAVLTMHHWSDRRAGLLEMQRVARECVVILTWDPQHSGFWLVQDYFPEILALDRRIFPPLHEIEQVLGEIEVQVMAIPHDCSDGFLGAYWRRPERYLDPDARAAISTFARIGDVEAGLTRLRQDLTDGWWQARNAHLLAADQLDAGYRLIVARTGSRSNPQR